MSRRQPTDVHEMLKYEMLHENNRPYQAYAPAGRAAPAPAPTVNGVSDQYMMLDSFLKEPSSDTTQGMFIWNFMVQGQTSGQNIGVRDEVRNVIEIQAGAFTIPILQEVAYLLGVAVAPPLILTKNNTAAGAATAAVLDRVQYPASVLVPSVFAGAPPANTVTSVTPWINNPYSQLPSGSRLTVQVKEAGHQSYSDLDGARHHFEFIATHLDVFGQNPNYLSALPLNGTKWDSYVFTDPITYLHGITLILRGPDIPINFLPDVYYNVVVSIDGNNNLFVTIPDLTLLAGDRVVIKGFRMTAVAGAPSTFGLDVINNFINRSDGFVINTSPVATFIPPAVPVASAPLPPSTPIPTFPALGIPATSAAVYLDPCISVANLVAAGTLNAASTSACYVYVLKRRIRFPIHMRMIIDRKTNSITV